MSASPEEEKKRKAETEDLDSAKKAKPEIEKEQDAPADKRPTLETEVGFRGADTTLNVFSAMRNQVLMGLTEGGMQHLLAGARANVGVKTGRYFYEMKILESLSPAEASQGRGPQPRQVLKLGFSTSSAPLVLNDSEESAYFDADGMFVTGKTKEKKSQSISRDNVVGLLLNLDANSSLANTISVFHDGVRVSETIPLPENLKGKALFPHVTFRQISLQLNMGSTPLRDLPFKCRMLQTAAKADVEIAQDPAGKFEVLVPVGLPDEGTFDWLDGYLQENPDYMELSDRKIQDWASSSGLPKPKAGSNACNDKPSFNYNVPSMDDGSIQRLVKAITPMVPRNYVVMEVKSNLVKDERRETLKRFNPSTFKKIAVVVMGEADAESKKSPTSKLVDKKRKAEDLDSAKKAKPDTEKEEDAPADKRPALDTEVGFHGVDTTLNVLSAMDNQVLTALTEGGMQHLLAGARANVGVKNGRYFYEMKILESLSPAEAAQGRGPQPRQVLKLGFSTSSAPLLLNDSEESVYFEADGVFVAGKTKQKKSQSITRDNVVGILLNLDASSPLANTISMFRDGVRISEPIPLPENLKGKALFPHVTYRHVSLHFNMGATPLKALPFTCRMLQTAAKADVEIAQDPSLAGKFEVLVPVGIPDEGTFDWLDCFLQKNPKYVELSDRKIQDWAARSGLPKPKGGTNACNDRPSFNYQVPSMDDGSIQQLVKAITPMVPRNYVVMEVKSNLVKEERIETLKRFNTPNFKKIALVVMGDPDVQFKQKAYTALLVDKQAKLDTAWKAKKAAAKRQKELQEMRRKADEQRKKKLEEAKKKEEGEGKDEEMKEEEVKKEEVKQEVKDEDDGLGDEPPKAELTDEEKKKVFRPKAISDLAPTTLSKFLQQFTLPEKSEGFDEVRFVWDQAPKCKEYLRKWILEAKRTTLIEHLQPSADFTRKFLAWQKQQLEWQQKQNLWKGKAKNPQDDAKALEVRSNLDIFAVEDVNDINDGEPLYAQFESADWALLQLRYELYLLQEAFKKDVNDPDRSAIPEPHLSFYYNRYFKKQLSPGIFSLKNNTELLQMIKDVVTLKGEPAVLTSQLDAESLESPDIFVKFTEEARRERKRRAEAGDETSMLRYTPPAANAPPPPARPMQQQWQPAPRQTPRPQQQWQGGGGGPGGGGSWNRW